MTIDEAMEEVLDVAKGPRRTPACETWVEKSGVELVGLLEEGQIHRRVHHEALTPAQETVCRWVWNRMARHFKPFEAFETGFLYDYNIDHELALWVRMLFVFEKFTKRHPSARKEDVVLALCHLSCGLPPVMLKAKQAKKLTNLWQGKGMGSNKK